MYTHDDNIKLYFKKYQTFWPQGAFVSSYYIEVMYIKTNQYNAFCGRRTSERDSEPCTCEIAPGYLQ